MKHIAIDYGQECVRIRVLRDKAICLPTWVGALGDLAEISTKTLSAGPFRIMRGRIMAERPS